MTFVVKLSSKGQFVIPGAVRRALRLMPGAELRLEVVERQIVLEPVADPSPVNALYGRFAGRDLLSDLEQEHRQEIEREHIVRP